jgi:hypothetical protein
MDMKRIIPALAVVVPLLGCGDQNKETPVFGKVEIERLLPLDAKGKTTIQDHETVAKLAVFFPEMGRGKSSDIAGGWVAAYRLKFIPIQGDPVTDSVDPDGEVWSEGNGRGDWRAKPGLKGFLNKLFSKEEDKRSEGSWSEAVNGLLGRLVRYVPPRVNRTEIIGISVELKNVSTKPLAVQNDPASVRVRLGRADGSIIDPSLPFVRSGPVANPEWSVFPPNAYLGFSLYDYGVGVPDMEGAMLALLPPSRVWVLKPGKYTLWGTFTVQLAEGDDRPKNAWMGKLDLPPLEIDVR